MYPNAEEKLKREAEKGAALKAEQLVEEVVDDALEYAEKVADDGWGRGEEDVCIILRMKTE